MNKKYIWSHTFVNVFFIHLQTVADRRKNMGILKVVLKMAYDKIRDDKSAGQEKIDWRSGATWEPFYVHIRVRLLFEYCVLCP